MSSGSSLIFIFDVVSDLKLHIGCFTRTNECAVLDHQVTYEVTLPNTTSRFPVPMDESITVNRRCIDNIRGLTISVQYGELPPPKGGTEQRFGYLHIGVVITSLVQYTTFDLWSPLHFSQWGENVSLSFSIGRKHCLDWI